MAGKTLIALALLATHVAGAADTSVRDPFATLANAPQQPEFAALKASAGETNTPSQAPFELRAVLWGENPLANISGMIVAAGDRVNSYTVDRIDQRSVFLRRGNDRVSLTLPKDN